MLALILPPPALARAPTSSVYIGRHRHPPSVHHAEQQGCVHPIKSGEHDLPPAARRRLSQPSQGELAAARMLVAWLAGLAWMAGLASMERLVPGFLTERQPVHHPRADL